MTVPRNRGNMSTGHIRIAELAKEDKGRKFYSIAHLLTEEALYEAFGSLRKDASVGVDRVTYAGYEVDARENIQKLHDRMKNGQYRAQPLRRVYIEPVPKVGDPAPTRRGRDFFLSKSGENHEKGQK